MRALLFVPLSLAFVACEPPDPVRARALEYRAALDRANVTMIDSVSLAQLETANGIGIHAELLTEETPLFTIGALATEAGEEALKEVRIDAVSGDIVSLVDSDGTVQPCPDTQPLPLAIESAQGELGGDVVTIAPDDDGQCNRELHVLRDSTLWSVKLAPDGAVLVEEEDDDAD